MMKILAAVGIVLLSAAVASAGWTYVVQSPVACGPRPVAVNACSASPVCTYTAYSYPVYRYPAPTPYVVARPVVYGAAPVVYRVPRYARPWLYVPGQPVRNVLRATFR